MPLTRRLMTKEAVLKLSRRIGQGYYRDCWLHPHDIGLCIKTPRIKGQACPQCEADAYNYPRLVRKGLAGVHVPKVFGLTETDR